jgi:hypothetical protein
MNDRDDLHQQLEKAVHNIHFDEHMKQHVLNHAKPSFWEREIQIPISFIVVPALLMVIVSVGLFHAHTWFGTDSKKGLHDPNKMVTLHSGTFYEQELEKRRASW